MKFAASLIVAVATVAASTADACWLRTNPSVEFASVQGLDPTKDLGLTVLDQDQKLCKQNVRLDVFKTSAGATTGLMCVRGKKAQRKFCGGDAVACCAAGKLSDKAKAALGIAAAPIAAPSTGAIEAPGSAPLAGASIPAPSAIGGLAQGLAPSIAGTAGATQDTATVTPPDAQAGATIPAASAIGGFVQGLAPSITATPEAVQEVAPVTAAQAATPVAAAAGSDGAQTARAGCWKQLSGVVHFASLAGVNLSSDAGLTNVFTDNALCDSSARVDVHTSNANEKFGMVCVRGQEAQREFCGGKVACCTPGAFVSGSA